MNKFKKLAVAAVSVVMAGTMAVSFAACGSKVGKDENKGEHAGADLWGIQNEDGTLNYDVYKNREKVTLNLAVGHEKLATSTSFRSLGDEITLPDGNKYSDKKFKPAWVQMGEDLNITWNDIWDGSKTSENLNTLTTTNQTGSSAKLYDNTDLFTTDLSVAVSKSAAGTSILNLADYLDYMPNFRNFLNENPVVYLSLLQDGMNTSTGAGQKILVAPYFDGYDDIERYCIIRHDWAEKLLNGSTATGSTAKYSEACAGQTYATAFMGSANYTVDALSADGQDVQKVTKNYEAALKAAKDESKPLGAAYKAIAGAAYDGNSGNIVDLMNAALAKNADATGAQLVDLFRAYIDVAFTAKNGKAYYSADKRANLFTGYDAAWDVDDLVAMLRCVKTNESVLVAAGQHIGGIAPRSGQNDRTPDIVSLACQLYGVRGGTSRNEYTYIAKDGSIKDARTDKNFYEAVAKMNLLFKEGLIADYSGISTFTTSSGLGTNTTAGNEYFMVYDYSQTQTLAGFLAEDSNVSHKDFPNGTPAGYYFAPILTPVSKWDVDGNGTIAADEYFRFTESWRSTKTGGLAVNGALAEAANKNKLDAALQFIDYLYSEDGQIVSTFGPMAKNAAGEDGFWYNEPATDAEVKAGKYFRYKGVRYSGTDYKGNTTPTITENVYKSFKGESVNGWRVNSNSSVSGAQLSFTSYARMLIGSTLPVGVKDQSFENQLTSKMGQVGANRVGQALAKDVVKGMTLEVKSDSYWYTAVPTGLPVNTSDQQTLDSTEHMPFKYMTGTQVPKGDKNFFSVMNTIVLNGTSQTYNQQNVEVSFTSIDDLLAKVLSGTKTYSGIATERQIVFNTAWTKAKQYWNYLSKN